MCSFSPCIEQVQRTCEELESNDFGDITTMECLVRSFDIRTINMPMPTLGQLPEGSGDGEPAVKHLKTDVVETSAALKNMAETTQEAKMDTSEYGQDSSDDNDDSEKSDSEEKSNGKEGNRHDIYLMGKRDAWNYTFKTACPPTKMPGHTGFLTFATLYPA